MSRVSKSIFVLEDKYSEILFDYINLSFLDIHTYKSSSIFKCYCCEDFDSVIVFSKTKREIKDQLTNWVYNLSISYLKQSGINADKMNISLIECIRADDSINLKNTKKATVIFHFNGRTGGYITTHENDLNYLIDDRKYIVVTFE